MILLWRYKRKLPAGFSALHNTSRGVALYGDKVYLPALDATLVALDAKTGKVAWEAKVEDWKTGYYMTMAPLVVKGKVLVGVAGGEFGVRGFVAGVRRRDRQAGVEDLHRPGARRARQRDVAEAGHLEDRRRFDLDDRQLRCRQPTRSIGAPATPRPGSAISGPATTSTRPRRSRSMATPARSRAISSTTRTNRGTGTR